MRKVIAVLIIIPLLLLSGCWDAREINELGFVLSIGLDKAGSGFKVTAQIANPEAFSKTQSGYRSSHNKTFWIVSANGKTIFEAIRNMASKYSRRIFWAHIKVIVISEKLARSNTLEVFDFFTRNHELRFRTLIAVTPDKAEKIINVEPQEEKDPGIYLEKIIENQNLTGKSYSIMLKDFLQDYLDTNTGQVTSRLVIDKSKSGSSVKASGAYVFYGNKVYGTLNKESTRGLLWIRNKMKESIMVVYCPYDKKPVTLEIKGAKASYKSSLVNGIPNFTIKVKVNASVVEQACLTDFNDMNKLSKLSGVLEASIHKDIKSTITTAKNMQVDFPGLSHILHRQHKEEWNQVSSKWNKIFKSAKVNIIEEANINHVSLAKPLEPSKADK